MPHSPLPGADYHVITPAAHPGLTCRFLKPADFQIADLPGEVPDFSQGKAFLPLAVALTPYGPMVFTIAARPAYDDGVVSQWLEYLMREEGYQPDEIRETQINGLPAVTCDALQMADGVTLRMRFVLFEDDGRLFQLCGMAPEPLWASAVEKLAPMLASFELREPRGARTPLRPGQAAPAATALGEQTGTAPTPEENAPEPPEAAPADSTTPVEPPTQTARLTAEELAALALAEDASTLDADHPTNVNLLYRGAGFVPRVLAVDLPGKSAKVGAGAVEGFFRLPLGWHVVDDGKRALIFDAGGRIQVSLNQRWREELSPRDFAGSCVQQYLDRQPGLDVASIELDGIFGAGVRGADIEGETLDQYFLVRDLGRPRTFLVARVTAKAEDATPALNLAGDILATFEAPDVVAC